MVLIVPALAPASRLIDQLLGLVAVVLAAGAVCGVVQYAGLDPGAELADPDGGDGGHLLDRDVRR